MASESFQDRVDALTNFGSTDNNALADWLTDGAVEIINLIPPNLLLKCGTETRIISAEGLTDFDTSGQILGLTRYDDVRHQPCREIPGLYRDRATDSGDLMYYGTASDPVFWKWNNILSVHPEPSATNPVLIQHVFYPTFDTTGTDLNVNITDDNDGSIVNFPNEVEYLVVLYASIKATESLLVFEEDDDLYIPIINVLKSDYSLGLQAIGSKIEIQKQRQAKDSSGQMKSLVSQMLEYQKQK